MSSQLQQLDIPAEPDGAAADEPEYAAAEVLFSLSLSAVCRESVCQDMSLAVLSADPKVSVFKCHIGVILRQK